MTPRTRSILLNAGSLLLGVTLGVVGSQRYWFRWALAMRHLEIVSRASLDIVVLSEWRTGHDDRARAVLERAVDNSVAAVYSSALAHHENLPESAVKMIQLAKVYRTAFPPPPKSHPSLREALDSVAMPSATYCSPAVRQIMAEAKSRSSAGGT